MRYLILFVFFLCSSLFADDDLFKSVDMAGRSGLSSRSSIALEPAFAEVPVDSSYVIGPGDFLDLMLEDNYLSVQVAPDGSIAIEECGVVFVGGKPLSEAREMILDLAAKRYKRDQCYVQLSALKRFRVNAMGAIVVVGQQLVDPQTRLSFFIRQLGGFLSNANTEDVLVIRGKDTLHVNFSAMSNKGNFEDDVMLEQGDRVFVPYVNMGDNITMIFPGFRSSVAYSKDRTLQDYYELSGAARMHNFGYKDTEVEFSVQELLVYVGGAVNYIGRYPYNPSWHALDYIAAAGINTITGSWNQVRVWRGKKPKSLSLSVTEDQILPGDYIEIPKSHYESFKDFTLFLVSLLTVVSSAFLIYATYNNQKN